MQIFLYLQRTIPTSHSETLYMIKDIIAVTILYNMYINIKNVITCAFIFSFLK